MKEVRDQTHAKIRIEDLVHGADERVIVISPGGSDKEGESTGDSELALHQLLSMIWEADKGAEEGGQVTARLLVTDVGCLIGKAGAVISQIRSDSGATILLMSGSERGRQMPLCAFSTESVVQVQAGPAEARKAMQLIIAKLKENAAQLAAKGIKPTVPSAAAPDPFQQPMAAQGMMFPMGGMGAMGAMFGLGGKGGDEVQFRLLISSVQTGQLIGKGGSVISQLRQALPGAKIRIEDAVDGCEDRIVLIASPDTPQCMAQLAVSRIQAQLDKNEANSVTKLVVPKPAVGAILGKGGAVISEIRQQSRANIRLLNADESPACCPAGDQVLTISAANFRATQIALALVTQRLRVFAMTSGVAGPKK